MRGLLIPALAFILLTSADGALVAQTAKPECHPPQQARQVANLFFGRDIAGRPGVSEAAWARFVARELTPRFPGGLTITDAQGQRRDPSIGTITREPSKRVEIVLSGSADDQARLDAAVAAYKNEFHQHSVLIIVQTACVSF
jgi:hypothetical protein